MLSQNAGSGSADRNPATRAFVRAHITDWSKEAYIRGAYSYPSLGAELGDRSAPAVLLQYFLSQQPSPRIPIASTE